MDFSDNVWAYYTARLLAGLAVGGISVAAPMYVAELAEAKIRGTLGTFFQLQITVGLLIGYVLGKRDYTLLCSEQGSDLFKLFSQTTR